MSTEKQREEARHNYRRNLQLASDAASKLQRAQSNAEVCSKQKRTAESDLSAQKTHRNNLEDRLLDVKSIISDFDGDFARTIEKTNSTASISGERYVSAIKCSAITSANIADTFRMKSVTQDDDSNMAYQSCVDEKARLENALQTINDEISRLNKKIDELNTSFRYYANIANNSYDEAVYYRKQANKWAAFL